MEKDITLEELLKTHNEPMTNDSTWLFMLLIITLLDSSEKKDINIYIGGK